MPLDPMTDHPGTATQVAARLRRREVTAVEVAESLLRRIDEVNPVVNALVTVDPDDVLDRARVADQRLDRGERLPLLGVPVTVKDSLDVAGMRTTGGSWARRERLAERDASAVARLRAAGAVIVGKTNVPELCASYETDNAVFGRTANPLDLDRTPGGSSGGEGAALAAGMSVLGLGTDGGGSIRVPAHYCGVVGLRPTAGRTPETGQWPPTRHGGAGDMSCVGPLATAVEDLALALEVIAGPDGIDPFTVPVALADWQAVDPGTLRVAVCVDDGVVDPTPGTRDAVATAADILRARGAQLVTLPPASTADATELFFAATGAEGGADFLARVADSEGHHVPQFRDFLATLTVRTPSAAEWFALHARLHGFRREVRRWLAGVDVLLTPVVAGPAPRHGEAPGTVPAEEYLRYRAFNFTHTMSVAGLPAASVPVGREDGLPVGVQVVGHAWREDVVLAAAAVIEAGAAAGRARQGRG